MGRKGTEWRGQRGPSGTGQGPGRTTRVVEALKKNNGLIRLGLLVLDVFAFDMDNTESPFESPVIFLL